MSLIKMVMKKYIKIPELSNFKNALFVGPHPDDIEFGCGATIDKMVKNGCHIHFLIVTDGASGSNDPLIDNNKLKEIRKNESIKSKDLLNVETIDFVDLKDGGTYTENDVINGVLPYVLKYSPDIIFSVDPDLETECHSDHLKVGRAIKSLVHIIPYKGTIENYGIKVDENIKLRNDTFLALYFTDKPNYFYKVSKENMNRKFESLKCHESQMTESELLFTYFKAKSIEFGITHFKGRVEEFKILHPNTQHVYSLGL